MRKILFRGKHTRTGEWVEGLLWKKKYKDNRLFISCFPDKDDNEEIFIINPETVGQYTGLTDKNGKKIFEGDIVKIDEKYIRYVAYSGVSTGFVKLHYISRCVSEGSTMLGYGYDSYKHTIEVIGNIHDNPELLEGGE